MNQSNSSGENEVRIIRGKIGSVSLYEITDNELNLLEKGSPSSIYLNFAIFLFSIGISFFITLVTTSIEEIKVYTSFLVFTIIGILGGSLLFFIWYRMKGEVSEVITKIKSRINVQEEAQGISEDTTG